MRRSRCFSSSSRISMRRLGGVMSTASAVCILLVFQHRQSQYPCWFLPLRRRIEGREPYYCLLLVRVQRKLQLVVLLHGGFVITLDTLGQSQNAHVRRQWAHGFDSSEWSSCSFSRQLLHWQALPPAI